MTVKKKKPQDEALDNNTASSCETDAAADNCQDSDENGSIENKVPETEPADEKQDSTEKIEQEETREELLKKLSDKQKESQEYLDMLKRTMADFDNYRKRTTKEKESVYDDGFADAVKTVLPVLDNLERAVNASTDQDGTLYEGLKMVLKIFYDILEKSGVSEIETDGQKFNPEYHNAVMHIEDDSFEENTIVEVLQKGYTYKSKILRHSMVKVAN